MSLNKLGDALVAVADLRAARERFDQSLEIRKHLALAKPASAEAQRDLFVSYFRLGRVTGEAQWWSKALEIAQRLNTDGRLAPSDAKFLDPLRAKGAVGNKNASAGQK